MKWRKRAYAAAFALVAGCAGQDGATVASGVVTVVYSGNVDGEIEPCG